LPAVLSSLITPLPESASMALMASMASMAPLGSIAEPARPAQDLAMNKVQFG